MPPQPDPKQNDRLWPLILEIAKILGRRGMPQHQSQPRPKSGYIVRRDGTSGVEVYYVEADPAKHHEMQASFVSIIGPVLSKAFGASRVQRRDHGNLKGFLVKLA